MDIFKLKKEKVLWVCIQFVQKTHYVQPTRCNRLEFVVVLRPKCQCFCTDCCGQMGNNQIPPRFLKNSVTCEGYDYKIDGLELKPKV